MSRDDSSLLSLQRDISGLRPKSFPVFQKSWLKTVSGSNQRLAFRPRLKHCFFQNPVKSTLKHVHRVLTVLTLYAANVLNLGVALFCIQLQTVTG